MFARIKSILPPLIVAVAILAAWSNSYQSPLVFDDLGSIRDNDSIRAPVSLNNLLHPPSEGGQTVSGRPLLNISFAINHWVSGENYAVYRVTNVLIHIISAFLVFGISRQTIDHLPFEKKSALQPYFPTLLSLIWALHPLTTSAVSYLVQRAESLCALFLLLTLYAFIRARSSAKPVAWLTLSLAACFAGAATKEIMVAAPLIVLLWQWTFMKRPPQVAPKKTRIIYHTLLFSSWIPLAFLTINTGDRAGTASLTVGASSLEYLQIQAWAILHYLQLALWPSQLIFDYGRDLTLDSAFIWIGCGLVVILLLVASIFLTIKRSPLGFLGLSCFLILAPTSSIFPLSDPVFEHRFYLPLAFVSAFLLLVLFRLLKSKTIYLLVPLAFVLGIFTFQRNIDYQDGFTLWKQSVDYRPENARAQTNLGTLYLDKGRIDKAIKHLKTAVNLRPTPLRHHNLANSYALDRQFNKAIEHYESVLATEPEFQLSRIGLAQTLVEVKDYPSAIEAFKVFIERDPSSPIAWRGLAKAYEGTGDTDKSIEAYERIVSLGPNNASSFFDLGDALARGQRFEDAKTAFQKAAELDEGDGQAYANLGNIHLMLKDYASAGENYRASIAIKPTAIAHTNLAISLLYRKRIQDAKTELQKALEIDPQYRPAKNLIQKMP